MSDRLRFGRGGGGGGSGGSGDSGSTGGGNGGDDGGNGNGDGDRRDDDDGYDYSRCRGNVTIGGRVQKIPRCSPRTGRWSDPNRPGDSLWIPAAGTERARQVRLHGQRGIRFRDGYPVFEPFAFPSPDPNSGLPAAIVSLPNLNGSQRRNGHDFNAANAAYRELIGDPSWTLPDEYTWHHHQNCQTMVLVPVEVHGAPTFRHQGGASMIKNETCQ